MKRENKTYAEAMNDWKLQEAQRTFMGKFRSSIFHPRYDATIAEKLLGYVYRLLIIALVTAVGLYLYARFQSKRKPYRSHLAEAFGNYYGGTNAGIGPIAWPLFNNNISFKTFSMDGKPDSFYRHIEAKAIGLELGAQFFSDTWKFDKMNIHELVVDLKSGAMGEAGPATKTIQPNAPSPSRVIVPGRSTGAVLPRPTPEQPQLLTAGFAFRPDPSKIQVDSYFINSLTCNWGYSPTTIGSLAEASAILAPAPENPAKWVLSCNTGTFSQNWIKNARVEKLRAEISRDEVQIATGTTLLLGRAGRLLIHGPISLGDMPQLDLDLTLKDVDLRDLCPPEFHKFFMGTISGIGKMKGTTNDSSGIKMSMNVNFVKPMKSLTNDRRENEVEANQIASLTEIPILRALHLCTQDRGFLRMRFTEGSFTIETGERQMAMTNIDLVSPMGRIRGNLRCEPVSLPVKDAKPGETPNQIVNLFSGELLLGIDPERSKKIPLAVRAEHVLPQQADGLEWIKLSMTNDPSNEITASAARNIERLIRESWNLPKPGAPTAK